jgi:glutamine amidotransferase
MCRLYCFHANEPTKVECSLVHAQNALLSQSRHDALGRKHADGWGIACYGDRGHPGGRLPTLVRHKTAAFDDTQFCRQAETLYAQTVVAHVRLATVGYVGPLNSHPFTYEGWTFAHNGTLPGFDRLGPQLAEETESFQNSRLGETDSEQLFLWMLNRFRRDEINFDVPDCQALERSISTAICEIDRRCRDLEPDEPSRLTFVLTDGQLILGGRWHNPLHWLDRRDIRDCEICGIPHIRHNDATEYRAVVFASEPITQEAWEEIPDESVFTVNEKFELSVSGLQTVR